MESRPNRLFRRISAFLLLTHLHASSGNTADSPGELQKKALEHIVGETFPTLEEVLPGYKRPEKNPPSLIVGNLVDSSTNEIPWGPVLGDILRWNLTYCPDTKLLLTDTNPKYLRTDLQTGKGDHYGDLADIDVLTWVYPRMGIEHALTGTVDIRETTYALRFILWSLPNRSMKAEFDFSGPLEGIPESLDQAVIRTHEKLGIPLDEASLSYLKESPPTSYDALGRFAEFLRDTWDRKHTADHWSNLFDQLYHEDAIHPYGLLEWVVWKDSVWKSDYQTYLKEIDQFRARWPEDKGTQFHAARSLYPLEWEYYLNMQKDQLVEVLLENPHDPMPLLDLGANYTGLKEFPRAYTVLAEAVDRWPDNYRVWWGLTDAIHEHAWHVRGTDFWDEITPSNQKLFTKLITYVHVPLDKALELFPQHTAMWRLKLSSYGAVDGYSPQLMECFEQAVAHIPNDPSVYRTTLNYLLPQWGGSVQVQKRIFERAVKENPDDVWPYEEMLSIGDFRLRQVEGKLFSIEEAVDLPQELLPVVRTYSEEKKLGGADWLALQIFLRAGATEDGKRLIRRMIDLYKEDPAYGEGGNLYIYYNLALFSLAFQDESLTNECLALCKEHPKTPSYNVRLPVIEAIATTYGATPEAGIRLLEEAIRAEPERLFTRMAYAEAGTRHETDPQLWEESLARLRSVKGVVDIETIDWLNQEYGYEREKAVENLDEMLKHLADGFEAVRSGKLWKAVEPYSKACEASHEDHRFLDSIDPTLIAVSYRIIHQVKGQPKKSWLGL